MRVASVDGVGPGATSPMVVNLPHIAKEWYADGSAGSQDVEDLCQPKALHTPSPALTLEIKNNSQNVTAMTAATVTSGARLSSLDEQQMEDFYRPRSPHSKRHSPVAGDQAEQSKDTATASGLQPANVQDFRDPHFRHEECPPHPEYCRNRCATVEIPRSSKNLKKGKVRRGRRFSMAQANRQTVWWLLRHSSCSNAEILQRAWRHRLAQRKDVPLRDRENKAEFLSRWYPQWLTRIASELDGTLATGGWTTEKKIKKQRRARAKQKRDESQD